MFEIVHCRLHTTSQTLATFPLDGAVEQEDFGLSQVVQEVLFVSESLLLDL